MLWGEPGSWGPSFVSSFPWLSLKTTFLLWMIYKVSFWKDLLGQYLSIFGGNCNLQHHLISLNWFMLYASVKKIISEEYLSNISKKGEADNRVEIEFRFFPSLDMSCIRSIIQSPRIIILIKMILLLVGIKLPYQHDISWLDV